jgi:hypothetical protein
MLFAFLSIALVSCTAKMLENRPVLESITTPEVLVPKLIKAINLIEADKDKTLITKKKQTTSFSTKAKLTSDPPGRLPRI